VTLDEIKEDYKDDRDLSTVISWLTTGNIPDSISYRKNTAQVCHYWQNINLLKFQDGVLYRKWIEPNDRSKDHEQIVVPGSLVERILYTYHDNSCHSGFETALEFCRRKFYFYKMKREFKMYCDACIVCARNKQPQKVLVAPLKPIVYHRFNQCISIDFNEPSKKRTKKGHVALLCIVDMYSNYVVCKPTKSTDSSEVIKIIMREWILKFGAPSNILHDMGSHFT
ncbi:MAG: transposase family protein, partial [Cytophagales bacterium]|nr:transposase family protein [Cytophagales bacterium]